MAKTKKTFDKELMYKKIMPTSMKKPTEQVYEDEDNPEIAVDNENVNIEDDEKILKKSEVLTTVKKDEQDNAVFKSKELAFVENEKNNFIIYNITEKLVLEKLDITLKKMNCCKCDRCKEDIIAMALNSLKPMYVVASREEIQGKIESMEQSGLEVTSAVLKAVLAVRKNPRH